jgi:hypothetical protein
MESNSVLLKHIYAKPFMRYDKLVLSSVKDQFFVVYGELVILKQKVHNLISFFLNRAENWKSLIQHVAPKVSRKLIFIAARQIQQNAERTEQHTF